MEWRQVRIRRNYDVVSELTWMEKIRTKSELFYSHVHSLHSREILNQYSQFLQEVETCDREVSEAWFTLKWLFVDS